MDRVDLNGKSTLERVGRTTAVDFYTAARSGQSVHIVVPGATATTCVVAMATNLAHAPISEEDAKYGAHIILAPRAVLMEILMSSGILRDAGDSALDGSALRLARWTAIFGYVAYVTDESGYKTCTCGEFSRARPLRG